MTLQSEDLLIGSSEPKEERKTHLCFSALTIKITPQNNVFEYISIGYKSTIIMTMTKQYSLFLDYMRLVILYKN